MHSSRMPTVLNSSRLCSRRSLVRGGCLVQGAVPGPGGAWSGGVPGPGVSARGVLGQGGVCSWGCAWSRGVSALGVPGLEGIPACTEVDPPLNRMTDRCKNITFATLLRTVNIHFDAKCERTLIQSTGGTALVVFNVLVFRGHTHKELNTSVVKNRSAPFLCCRHDRQRKFFAF